MKNFKIWLKIDIFGELALRHVNLLFQKTTADDESVLTVAVDDRRRSTLAVNGRSENAQ